MSRWRCPNCGNWGELSEGPLSPDKVCDDCIAEQEYKLEKDD